MSSYTNHHLTFKRNRQKICATFLHITYTKEKFDSKCLWLTWVLVFNRAWMWRERFKMKISTKFHSTDIFSRDYLTFLSNICTFSGCLNRDFSLKFNHSDYHWLVLTVKKYVKSKRLHIKNRVKFPNHSRFFKVSFTLAAWLLDGGATEKRVHGKYKRPPALLLEPLLKRLAGSPKAPKQDTTKSIKLFTSVTALR